MGKVLIDADVCVHAVCNQAERSNPEGEPLPNVLHSLKLQVRKWIADAGGDPDDWNTFQVYLSGPSGTNFRYDVASDYKGKRPPKPRYFKEARRYLFEQWQAREAVGEADDALATAMWRHYLDKQTDAIYFGEPVQDWCEDVCVSVDKDLLMVPGWHYNPRKEERVFIDEPTGWYNMFKQMLTGDSVDNILGCATKRFGKRTGVGPKAAEKLLDMNVKFNTADAYASVLYKLVIEAYATTQARGEFVAEYTDIFQAADLLWMVRDGRRGSAVLMSLVPGHISKAMFDQARQEKIDAPNQASKRKGKGKAVPAVDSNPAD